MIAWIIDGSINLTDICSQSGWHLSTAVRNLTQKGIPYREAECFVAFAFNNSAFVNDGEESREYLLPGQWRRLSKKKTSEK